MEQSSGSGCLTVSRRTRVCAHGWCYLLLALAVFALAVLRDENLLLIVSGILAAPLVLNWYVSRRTLRQLSARREAASEVRVGQWLTVNLTLQNRGRRLGVWGVVAEEELRRAAGGRSNAYRATIPFGYVRAGDSRQQSYRIRLPRRGSYRMRPLTLSTSFPFGFVEHRVTWGEPTELIVCPRLGRLTRPWQTAAGVAIRGIRGAKRPGRAPGDLFAVRPWQPGDSSRWVHWRKSARHGALIVRQFERTGDPQLAILLDLVASGAARPEDADDVERAVSLVATLVAQISRRGGSQLLLGISGQGQGLIAGRVSPLLAREASRRLALAEPTRHDCLPELWQQVRSKISRETTVVLVSLRSGDAAMGERWWETQPAPSGKSFLVANPRDPQFAELFQFD